MKIDTPRSKQIAPPPPSSKSARFRAPWGLSLKIITPLVTALMLASVVLIATRHEAAQLRGWLGGFLVALLAGGPLFMVRGYEVAPGELTILRPGWRTRIPLDGLRSVEPGDGLATFRLRLFGNGGFWSITGWFWNRKLGRFRSFANDPGRVLALRFERRCAIVVSPADPAAFTDALKHHAGLN